MLHAAVQEERQRAKDKNENEVESTSCANEDMPVEKILEAEQAVEPKTETYIETNLGAPSNSVSWYFHTFSGKHSRAVLVFILCTHVHIFIFITIFIILLYYLPSLPLYTTDRFIAYNGLLSKIFLELSHHCPQFVLIFSQHQVAPCVELCSPETAHI